MPAFTNSRGCIVNDPFLPAAESPRLASVGEELTPAEAETILRPLGNNYPVVAPAPAAVASAPPLLDAASAGPRPEANDAGGTIEPAVLQGDSFRVFLEVVPDASVVINQEGCIVEANSQAEHLFGYRREEMLGHLVELLVPERWREKHVADRDGYFHKPRARPMSVNLDLAARRKDGREIPVEISLSPLRCGEQTFVVSTIRDISERRRGEARLRKLEARYRTLVEGIPAVTFMAALDEAGNERELYVSPQIEVLLGFSQKEWADRGLARLFPEGVAGSSDPLVQPASPRRPRTLAPGVCSHLFHRRTVSLRLSVRGA
jgi:PAS domain S-box-containing protein